jgi:hypothetical protein
MRHWLVIATIAVGAGLAACSDAAAPTPSLRIYARASAAPSAKVARFSASARRPSLSVTPATDSASPTTLPIPMYALYLSANADCSSPVLAQDYGAAGQVKDFVTNPVLFEASPTAGTYHCLIFRMSDSFATASNKTFGPCKIDSLFVGDIYRDGQSDWKDQDLATIVGHGTDAVPVNDHVAIFITRDTAATIARGVSTNQVIPMTSDLVVPGQATLVWNLTGAIQDEGGFCSILPRPFGFE